MFILIALTECLLSARPLLAFGIERVTRHLPYQTLKPSQDHVALSGDLMRGHWDPTGFMGREEGCEQVLKMGGSTEVRKEGQARPAIGGPPVP